MARNRGVVKDNAAPRYRWRGGGGGGAPGARSAKSVRYRTEGSCALGGI